jgi:hypothetical protein
MRRLIGSIALAGALAFATGVHAQDNGIWDDNSWTDDDFGYYDENFDWNADEGFDRWYADSDEDWSSFYDDVGDEGLFDV